MECDTTRVTHMPPQGTCNLALAAEASQTVQRFVLISSLLTNSPDRLFFLLLRQNNILNDDSEWLRERCASCRPDQLCAHAARATSCSTPWVMFWRKNTLLRRLCNKAHWTTSSFDRAFLLIEN
eukprot:7399752-Pyramimonas_sp.AAC.3